MTSEQAWTRLTELEEVQDPTLAQMQELSALRYDVRSTCTVCGEVGTGEDRYDARGIYLKRCCAKCWQTAKRGYRPDVLTDPNYWADEQIEEDY